MWCNGLKPSLEARLLALGLSNGHNLEWPASLGVASLGVFIPSQGSFGGALQRSEG